uniref:IgGFc-binding protein N-terminal domain-containing protein n=1 Tax=Plectus sambesii TaxID=2011161 RepID=A0A914USW0_9BILA
MIDGRVLCLLLVSAVFAYADNNVSTVGKDFIFTFFNAYQPVIAPLGVQLLALVSNNNNVTANVVVTSSYILFKNIRVSVPPYSVLKIPLAPESIEDQYPGKDDGDDRIVVEDKGIRLQSDLPVAVYAHAELLDGFSADSFLVLPTVHLGMRYVAATNWRQAGPYGPNMIAVVAYQDNTQITIGNQSVTINALQVASIASDNVLSGTVISGNKPFGAISGCTCGFVGPEDACDYEATMLLPVGNWGTQFTAIPFMYLSTSFYQVMTNTNNTVVSAGGKTIATLNAGEYREFQIGAALITSNYPIQLIEMGQTVPNDRHSLGDPFFLQLPSTDKMSNANVLFQPTGFFESAAVKLEFFLRIVTNLAGTGTIQLDGTTI